MNEALPQRTVSKKDSKKKRPVLNEVLLNEAHCLEWITFLSYFVIEKQAKRPSSLGTRTCNQIQRTDTSPCMSKLSSNHGSTSTRTSTRTGTV